MKKIYCCEEHIEVAIDTIVDECETFPVMNSISEEEKLSTSCEYCRNTPIYMVANE